MSIVSDMQNGHAVIVFNSIPYGIPFSNILSEASYVATSSIIPATPSTETSEGTQKSLSIGLAGISVSFDVPLGDKSNDFTKGWPVFKQWIKLSQIALAQKSYGKADKILGDEGALKDLVPNKFEWGTIPFLNIAIDPDILRYLCLYLGQQNQILMATVRSVNFDSSYRVNTKEMVSLTLEEYDINNLRQGDNAAVTAPPQGKYVTGQFTSPF